MSLDASLKSASSLVRHRNVLTRGERLDLLASQGKWDVSAKGVFGLPKVGHRKLIVGGKTPKAEGEEAVAAPVKGAKGAPAAKGAAAAPAAKGAAGAKPAAGGKAAPAAKAAAPAAKKK